MKVREVAIESAKLILLAIAGLILFAGLAVISGCGKEGPTVPPIVTEAPKASIAPNALTIGVPTVVSPGTSTWVEGGFGFGGRYSFKNVSREPITWTVYSTSFDDQTLVLSAKTVTTQPGDFFDGSLDVRCRQVDAQQGEIRVGERATAAPFAHAFINGYGEPVGAGNARDGCDVPNPEPTPTPTPNPSPSPSPSPRPSPSPSPEPTPPPPPQPVGLCHVSNKGGDHDINLVVEYKTHGEGHEKHLDPSKYCPTDWLVYGPLAFAETTKSKDECKTEGKDTDKYCSCLGLIDKAKACRQ